MSIPLAAIFAFWCDWSVYGLWGGQSVGLALQSALYLRLIWVTSWERIAMESADRIQGELERLNQKQETDKGDELEPLK